MQLTNKNLWGTIKGTKQLPIGLNKLLEWPNKDDKTKAINGLSLLNYELHHIDLEKSSNEN